MERETLVVTFTQGERGLICRTPEDNGPWIAPGDHCQHAVQPVENRPYRVEIVSTARSGKLRFARVVEDIGAAKATFQEAVKQAALAAQAKVAAGPVEQIIAGRRLVVDIPRDYGFTWVAGRLAATSLEVCAFERPGDRHFTTERVETEAPILLSLSRSSLPRLLARKIIGGELGFELKADECPVAFLPVREALARLSAQIQVVDAGYRAEELSWPRQASFGQTERQWTVKGRRASSVGWQAFHDWLLAEIQDRQATSLTDLTDLAVPDFSSISQEVEAKWAAAEASEWEACLARAQARAGELAKLGQAAHTAATTQAAAEATLAELTAALPALQEAKDAAWSDYYEAESLETNFVASALKRAGYHSRQSRPSRELREQLKAEYFAQHSGAEARLRDLDRRYEAAKASLTSAERNLSAAGTAASAAKYAAERTARDYQEERQKETALRDYLAGLEPAWTVGDRRSVSHADLPDLSPRVDDDTRWEAERLADGWLLRGWCRSSCREDDGRIRRHVVLITD